MKKRNGLFTIGENLVNNIRVEFYKMVFGLNTKNKEISNTISSLCARFLKHSTCTVRTKT